MGGGPREYRGGGLGRARGYLRPDPCVGGAQAVIKPVVALPGDVVELGPEAVIVNGQRLPASSSVDIDGLGLPLPHAVWARHVVTADEFLAREHVPNSWDSRYLGPFSWSQVRAVAWPVWTVN